MNIEINNKTRSSINLKLVRSIAEEFFQYNKIKTGELSIAFVGDRVIKRLNRQYRKKDKVTDVLVFPDDKEFLGEIIIDYSQIKRQSKEFSSSHKDELVFILVHGLLHILGRRDTTKKEKENMTLLGKKFIKYYYDHLQSRTS